METIDALVRRVIEDYPRFVQEESQFERHLSQRENPDMRDALTVLWMRIHTVESWFALLEADERFVLRQMLTGDQQESAAQRAAALMWVWQTCKEGKTPWQIRERTLAKIIRFAEMHKEVILAIFTDR